jgi:hypothetical protein
MQELNFEEILSVSGGADPVELLGENVGNEVGKTILFAAAVAGIAGLFL